jgi:hypothetical protein
MTVRFHTENRIQKMNEKRRRTHGLLSFGAIDLQRPHRCSFLSNNQRITEVQDFLIIFSLYSQLTRFLMLIYETPSQFVLCFLKHQAMRYITCQSNPRTVQVNHPSIT